MKKSIIVLGDILAIILVTLVGFATHGEIGTGSPGPSVILPRMAASFFPLAIGWFLLAPWFGLFQKDMITNPRQLWRPALAMFFAAPLAVVLRGLILNAAILPVFAVVLGTASALGMAAWRVIYFLLMRRAG
jgi:hypothetical protein